MPTNLLKLIAVNAGRARDFFWISMDGAEESCSPEAFINTFPDFCASVFVLSDPQLKTEASFFKITRGNQLEEAIADAIEQCGVSADLYLVDTFELFTFTRNRALHRAILTNVLSCL